MKLTQDDIENAVWDLRRAVSRGPCVPVAHACLGTALFKMDQMGTAAEEAMKEALDEHPEYVGWGRGLGGRVGFRTQD